ncbi:MAG: LPS assembly lipoprotein LptE [Bacteroidota bacterium]|nr:LPS assembly lipoprotein LptE [Bacteroidota bacterium]
MNRSSIKALFFVVIISVASSCKMNYSFTGASIAPDVKTVSIQYFPNYAPLAQPLLSQEFTEALRNIFLSQTNLNLVERNGHLHFEGSITGYSTMPVAIQAGQISQASYNRLTITVNVKFINTKDETQNFEASFNRFTDYDSSKNLSDVEMVLIKEINDQLVQDIFNRAVSNW